MPPSQDPTKEKIWSETKKRLERFVPDLFADIFPDTDTNIASKQPVPAPAESSNETPPQETINEGGSTSPNPDPAEAAETGQASGDQEEPAEPPTA